MKSSNEKCTHGRWLNHLRILFRMWLTSLCLLVAFSTGAYAKEVTIHFAGFNYPPFYFEEDGRWQGIAVDLIDELSKRLDMKSDLTMYPFTRSLSHLKDGKVDGIMILIKNPERAKLIRYTIPILRVRGLIWASADRVDGAVDFQDLNELSEYKVGVTRGYSYGHAFDELLKNMDVEVANADLLNFRKLMSHRIDIFPGNEIVAHGLFREHPELRGRFVHSADSFISWDLHMGLSKRSHMIAFLPEINEVLEELIAEGFVDRLVEKYTY